jgi:hypothetical protein
MVRGNWLITTPPILTVLSLPSDQISDALCPLYAIFSLSSMKIFANSPRCDLELHGGVGVQYVHLSLVIR